MPEMLVQHNAEKPMSRLSVLAETEGVPPASMTDRQLGHEGSEVELHLSIVMWSMVHAKVHRL